MEDRSFSYRIESRLIGSRYLGRKVRVDWYRPGPQDPSCLSPLILFNDGQLLAGMKLKDLLEQLVGQDLIRPLILAAIHAGPERRQEYGTLGALNERGEGKLAGPYCRFVLDELLAAIRSSGLPVDWGDTGFGGFSLGGLSALDLVWNFPDRFRKAGVFSGSLWWRKQALGPEYVDDRDRIMHLRIREGPWKPGLKFFLECGTLDEEMDRNGNGVIDSVDDTLDLIRELKNLGYREPQDIRFVLIRGGGHDETTWSAVLPDFLRWGWGI